MWIPKYIAIALEALQEAFVKVFRNTILARGKEKPPAGDLERQREATHQWTDQWESVDKQPETLAQSRDRLSKRGVD